MTDLSQTPGCKAADDGCMQFPESESAGATALLVDETHSKKRWETIGKPWENRDLYGESPCFMGKSIFSTGPCSIAMKQITRGYLMWVKQCHFYHPFSWEW